jgi:tRNA threonylcarbamoyladenosine biosynthesis protein TsaE
MKHGNLTLNEFQALATTLGKKAAKTPLTVGLIGNLGSGKTTFAKAFAKALGIKSLKSPTFIVNQRYSLKHTYLYHMDFYRLDDKVQLSPLGLEEILSGKNIVLIEWVDKFPQIQKMCDILISFKVKPHNKRDVTIKSD